MNIEAIKARLGSISPGKMQGLPLAVQTLLTVDLLHLIAVARAVSHCGAKIKTVGNGFDAKNVYVIERKEMDKIGDALAALEESK